MAAVLHAAAVGQPDVMANLMPGRWLEPKPELHRAILDSDKSLRRNNFLWFWLRWAEFGEISARPIKSNKWQSLGNTSKAAAQKHAHDLPLNADLTASRVHKGSAGQPPYIIPVFASAASITSNKWQNGSMCGKAFDPQLLYLRRDGARHEHEYLRGLIKRIRHPGMTGQQGV
jgi:hypothetical protein